MNMRKFIAPTARQALRDIRDELGDEAVILSNRKVAEGVEIIAMANEAIEQLTDHAPAQKGVKSAAKPVAHAGLLAIAKSVEPQSEPVKPVAVPQSAIAAPQSADSILGEIKNMHSVLQQQLAAMSWNDVQQRDPQRAGLLRRMLNSGFSALLARQLMDKLPAGKEQGESWIKQVLKRNLRVAGESDDIVAKGGVYALIGPTGVGKTTTTAKLAARAVVRYGADKVALLTTDSYRIGAYEQLKIYGKILGVAVHAVKDTDDLRLTLSALKHKHLVLIDTVGMGQRDERVGDQNEMFDATGVQRLLLLNATSSGDTLEDVARMYHSEKVIGCIATKLDEAASLGAVLDVAVRHRLVMHYIANGQRVPEDLYPVNPDYLLHRALKPAEEKTPFTLHELEFPALMSGVSTGEAAYAL
ncbi:flagellar biosynthesis regulator FlhF [Ferrigenium kumadai]|uniref:Flagellar biosynthesis protein FlhF n=1 Tax=Ferrigenium kumadai TaxID=1682490 RepID=A0AAN1VYZ6_9PROT|nr:flagellar biosynthesis protein FlhF [Ferrigenium kumadai]BBI98748.1 flagellar biosynthesis regulator FlhF [Ferrigenium kumadai]